MINHEFRCLYIHIPKTAGNSINRAFGNGWEDHKDLRRYAAELTAATFDDYYKFAIVRNPWDRLFSDYNYQKVKSRAPESKLFLFKPNGEKRRFREWVEAALSDPHRYAPASWGGEVSPGIHRWSPQVDWITLDGRVAVDRVLRLENLPEDFAALGAKLNLPRTTLPRRNRRRHWHYSSYYDDATRDLVGAYYARDIEMFGYRFEAKTAGLLSVLQACATAFHAMPAATTRAP